MQIGKDLAVSPKGLHTGKWMVGLLWDLKLEAFLTKVRKVWKILRTLWSTMWWYCHSLCVLYFLDNKDRELHRHIDGLDITTWANNLYSVWELHLITRTTIFKYKLKKNHTLYFAADHWTGKSIWTNIVSLRSFVRGQLLTHKHHQKFVTELHQVNTDVVAIQSVMSIMSSRATLGTGLKV